MRRLPPITSTYHPQSAEQIGKYLYTGVALATIRANSCPHIVKEGGGGIYFPHCKVKPIVKWIISFTDESVVNEFHVRLSLLCRAVGNSMVSPVSTGSPFGAQ